MNWFVMLILLAGHLQLVEFEIIDPNNLDHVYCFRLASDCDNPSG